MIVKPKFGSEFVADFAFSFRRHNGLQWIFVEIEKASKKIFTKGDQFTSDFTQAEDQILNWEQFLDQHITYMQEKYEELYKPEFFLIYGRSSELATARKNKIESKFKSSSNKYFRTYDDLLNNFIKTVQNLTTALF